MLDRVKNSLNLTIIFIFVVAFIYFLVMSIIQSFSSNNIKEITGLNQNTVEIYASEGNIVKNYSNFFNVEKIAQGLILNLNEKKYDEVYSILSFEFQKNITKKHFMDNVEKYVSDNFKYETGVEYDNLGYINEKNLKKLYLVNDDEYIAVIKSTNAKGETKIGIKVVDNNNFVITYLEL